MLHKTQALPLHTNGIAGTNDRPLLTATFISVSTAATLDLAPSLRLASFTAPATSAWIRGRELHE